MTHFDKLKDQKTSVLAATAAAATLTAMLVIICVKSVSVLFKLNKALDLYIKEHKHRRSRQLLHDDFHDEYYDEFEDEYEDEEEDLSF